MLMVTLEEIETELDSTKQTGWKNKLSAKAKKMALDAVLGKLKKMQDVLDAEEIGLGKKVITDLILGRHKLSAEEHLIAVKRFGNTGLEQIKSMESLNKAQKQYIFKQMGWNLKEVE